MVNPYFCAFMKYWVNLIVFTLSSCLFVCQQLNGQQTNPFDIIITKHAINQEASGITSDTAIRYTNEDLALDTNIQTQEVTGDRLPDSIIKPIESISNSNPFTIKKTSDQLRSEESNVASNGTQSEVTSENLNVSPTANKTNWLSKLKPRQSNPKNVNYSLNFIFWILIASLLILAAVINLKRKSFLNLYRAITNDNYLKLLQREEYNGSSFFFLLLYFLFFLNAALFLYQLLIIKFDINGSQVFLGLFGVLIAIYIIRIIATFIIQITFPIEKEAKQYSFTIIMFNIIVGLLLIPVNILTAYAPFGPQMIYVGLGIIGLFYLLRQIRGLFIAARIKGLSYFHFFIYLCTFEVAPFFWIISLIRNWYPVS